MLILMSVALYLGQCRRMCPIINCKSVEEEEHEGKMDQNSFVVSIN